ncbi:MAG: hypothetical protein DRP93_01865 [Candidatus Neomarinimicrobiota bacterium]|nr:MAG: hypothetical protein DRP93_01865 [Candidatus Neomarinimicrobiota bacterium]
MKSYNTITGLSKEAGSVYAYMGAGNVDDEMSNYFPGENISANIGMSDSTENLPNLSVPILGKDSADRDVVFIDLRKFKHGRGEGTTVNDLTVRSSDRDSLIYLSRLLLKIDSTDMLIPIKHEYITTLAMFIYEKMSHTFLLNNIDKNFILTAIGAYVMNIADDTVTTEITHHVLKKQKLILDDTEEIIEIIDLVKSFPISIEGFVNYMIRADKTGKLSKLSPELLTSVMITGSIGDLNKRLILMSFEHPLPWLCLIDVHMNNMMLKKTFLTNNLKTFKRFTNLDNITTYLNKIITV